MKNTDMELKFIYNNNNCIVHQSKTNLFDKNWYFYIIEDTENLIGKVANPFTDNEQFKKDIEGYMEYSDIFECDKKNLEKGGKKGSSCIASNIYDMLFNNPYPKTFLNYLSFDVGESDGDTIRIQVKDKYYSIKITEIEKFFD